jgi:hypothetical protein
MPLFGVVPCVLKIDNSLGVVVGSFACLGSHQEKRQEQYTNQCNYYRRRILASLVTLDDAGNRG